VSASAAPLARAGARPTVGDRWIVGGLAVWLVLVLGAMGGLWRYKSRPGAPSDAPKWFPDASAFERTPGRPTLVMFAHPKCACTRASLAELRVVMSEFEARIVAHVAFFEPAGADASWAQAGSWDLARSIPGLRVSADPAGAEAKRFGAQTSGAVLLYGGDGRLLFAGGITGARGHVGDNEGRDQVVGLLRRGVAAAPATAVFGCAIGDPEP